MYRYGTGNIISHTFEKTLILKIKEIHFKITVRTTSHPLGWVLKKKIQKITSVGKDVENCNSWAWLMRR